MVYLVSNTKGGSGKSLFAGHILPEHILRKGKQDKVKLYEFDEHSRTSENYLKNSVVVNAQVISVKDIEEEIFNIKFDARTEDVILDIGAGELLEKIVSIAEKGIGLDNMVFVVPYSDDASIALYETVTHIKKFIEKPKIMIVLNRINFSGNTLEEAKEEAIDLYGSKKYSIEPNEILPEIEEHIKAAIPDISKIKIFASLESNSFSDLRKRYDISKNMNDEELEELWKMQGKISGDSATREEYVRNYGIMQREYNIAKFLENCEEFFNELLKLENS